MIFTSNLISFFKFNRSYVFFFTASMNTAMQEPEDRGGLMEFSYHEFYHLFTPALEKVF